ncbi:hypothetical protein CK203_033881 [Vitis vinifera]|uniref:Reverse transcriptase domain-containing protein n=1 Tax=Vitis vinifera TaxID=29760 RepID=A0A438HU27_VITVI|nr:hypothetical protein CK203_033881 [Vitis vinifera]
MSAAKPAVPVRDLVEEAKKRFVFLAICVVGLSYLMSSLLEASFSEEDVFKALSDLSGDKVPSPNGGVEDLKDFRLISFVGSLYKLLAKVLTDRLKKVVGKVASCSQNAFVEGRQILDASLIVNEAIDFLL